jgi:hypothetical protein
LVKFRKLLGEEGVEEFLASTIEVTGTLKLIAKKELSRIIVDSTVQKIAIAHPTYSMLLETDRVKLIEAAGLRPPSSSKPMPKRANCWATSPGVTPVPASSNA